MSFQPRCILITGGAGFIGANLVNYLLQTYDDLKLVILDKLTYAANPAFLLPSKHYRLIVGDVCDREVVREAMAHCDSVIHLAAESHVDRSIQDASPFVRTNVLGTQVLLDVALELQVERFLHVSTDEVYGSIEEGFVTETYPLNPSSPYSASKAASDLLVLAYHKTHQLPVLITRCSNNYGPNQHTEKFIPTVIRSLLQDQPIPLYGDGTQERDWLYVTDHCSALDLVLREGDLGNIYNVSAYRPHHNWEVIERIARVLGKHPQVQPVADRPGHDWRYAMDSSKVRALGWKPIVSFEKGITQTIAWYQKQLGV